MATALASVGPSSAGVALAQTEENGMRLSVPVRCDMARDCSIQKYVDRAAGPERRDYRCGTLTTDGHQGTDLRLRRFEDMARDVKVVAAAAGTVLRVRDGMADISVRDAATPLAPDRMAGNAVVVGHGKGWETQYSHLKRGSVRVRPGDRVAAGAELGAIGLSGNTEYPHLHFEVRRDGKAVDPFAAADTTSCGAKQPSLWTAAAAAALDYRPTVVLAVRFAQSAKDAPANFQGVKSPEVMINPEVLILLGNVSGVQSGDVEKFRILAPNGGVVLQQEKRIANPSLTWVSYSGVRRPTAGWQSGKYRGTYQLVRHGLVVGNQTMIQDVSG